MTEERFLTPRYDVSWDDIGEAVERLGGTRLPGGDDALVEWRFDGAAVRLFADSALHVDQLGVQGERRDDVAAALAAVLDTAGTIGLTFELVSGDTPIEEAVRGLR